MILQINHDELEWLLQNLRFRQFTDIEQDALYASLPTHSGTWVIPEFCAETVRERIEGKKVLISGLVDKMNEQTVRATINLSLSDALFNQQGDK